MIRSSPWCSTSAHNALPWLGVEEGYLPCNSDYHLNGYCRQATNYTQKDALRMDPEELAGSA